MASPKLRFKEFDGDWSTSKIDTIALVSSGGTPSRANPEYWDGYIPWVTTSLVDFNVIHSAEEFITKEGINNSSAKLFPKDTILMAMYGQGITRGKVAILGIEATTNQACCAIKLKDGFNTQFIFQNLMNRYDEIRDLSNDGGQKNLSAGIIKDISISIPSKEEQTKIASFLSAVDEKINLLTQKHELLSQYKQGMMQKLFSQQIRFKAEDGSEFGEWKQSLLGQNCHITTGKLDANAMNANGKYRFYTCAKNYFYIDNFAFDTEALLISGNGAHVGYIHYYKGKFNAYQRTYVLDGWEHNIQYVKYYLDKYLKIRINSEKKEGNTPYIVLSTLNEMPFQIPTFEEQTKIANFLSAIDQKIEVVAQQIAQTKQWKKGLLQQMFV
nr:restriction endonuclease subunit S [Acinetobacter sp. YH12218]